MEKIVISSQIAKGEIDYSDLNNDGSPDDRDDIISFFNSQGYSIPELGDDRCIIYGYSNGGWANFLDSGGNQIARGAEFFITSYANNDYEYYASSWQTVKRYKRYINSSHLSKQLFNGSFFFNTVSGVTIHRSLSGNHTYHDSTYTCSASPYIGSSGLYFDKFNLSD